MTPPRIIDLQQALFDYPDLFGGLDVIAVTGPDRPAFAVLRSGMFGDRWFDRGEVVVCDPHWSLGQAVVLVARTQGRPRLGHCRGTSFSGDRGELCSAERWMPVGALSHVWRRDGVAAWAQRPLAVSGAWRHGAPVVPVHEVGASWQDPRWSLRGGAERPAQSGQVSQVTQAEQSSAAVHQLSLFANAA